MLAPLPIDPHIDAIVDAVRSAGAALVVAPPGAGKTTRVPPALAADGRVIVLQPRRIAARALACRIAQERGFTPGVEVGWQVRFERCFGPNTRVLVATEGILTRRLQDDPLLEGFSTVVLDEFHERSLHADLALALVRQARLARADLRVVVMSATLDVEPVRSFLGGCPLIEVPRRPHPVDIEYAPHVSLVEAAAERARSARGHVLCFLPGAPEIRRASRDLAARGIDDHAHVLPLHGSLDPEAQDAALAPSTRRKLILATNLAETSLTIEGVTDVVDGGQAKVLRLDSAFGLDRLETERISRDSAEQRAGRAGRTGPGRALRLWDARDELRPHREPEIARVDLAGPLLHVLAWGGDPARFDWFEAPPVERMREALALLERLGATDDGRITEQGRALLAFGVHPRLARLLLDAGGGAAAAAACAILAEGWPRPPALDASRSDLLALADRIAEAPFATRRLARELRETGRRRAPRAARGPDSEEALLRAVLHAYPDRLARRRAAGSPRLLLAGGHGAVLAEESGVRDAEFLVAVDVAAGPRGPGSEARVRLASAVEREWFEPTHTVVEHRFDAGAGTVRALERAYRDAIPLEERPVDPDLGRAADLIATELVERGLGERGRLVLRRARFAGIDIDVAAIARQAATGRTTQPELELTEWLPAPVRRDLARLAPESIEVPSGRSVRLEYADDGSVRAAVKLQELFGLGATPRVGARAEPVTLVLLAPNGRPVQTTQDLASFWNTTYAEVRKELRGRYPKHPWPDDPWTAPPTARAKRRRYSRGARR